MWNLVKCASLSPPLSLSLQPGTCLIIQFWLYFDFKFAVCAPTYPLIVRAHAWNGLFHLKQMPVMFLENNDHVREMLQFWQVCIEVILAVLIYTGVRPLPPTILVKAPSIRPLWYMYCRLLRGRNPPFSKSPVLRWRTNSLQSMVEIIIENMGLENDHCAVLCLSEWPVWQKSIMVWTWCPVEIAKQFPLLWTSM